MKGKVVLITGGSSGIGRALALRFGRAGSRIFFTGRTHAHMQETYSLLAAHGIEHEGMEMDVASDDANQRLVARVVKTYGQLDVVIVNAGIGHICAFEDMTLADFDRVMKINFWSAVSLTHYALPYLVESKGQIIAISSIQGWRSTPLRSSYAASKFAMQGFYETLRTEMTHKGISILVACPGFTQSAIRLRNLSKQEQNKPNVLQREDNMMTAEKVAKAIYKAACRKKRDLWLTASGRLIIQINRFFPALADKLVTRFVKKEQARLNH